ncbi:hornerin-like [Megalops cyprinoides]|uniref:hornerin-like n=1 Tax=Megalops cyprinoides TaxID=118141 RepID=UPI001864EACC|nr:hornerin-like [Megalops cyprinoides]
MADELDRVRISAAELRAGASNLANHEESLRDSREERRGPRQREGKRPDLQRYQPVLGPGHRRRDTAEGEGPAGSRQTQGLGEPERMEKAEDFTPATDHETAADTKACQGSAERPDKDADCAGADQGGPHTIGSQDFGAEPGGRSDSLHHARADSAGPDSQQQDCPNPAAEPSATNACASRSPRPARKVRKPDREIYQPGGRRCQQQQHGAKDTGSSKEPERAAREEQRRDCRPGKDAGESEERGGGKRREDREKGEEGKETARKQEHKAASAEQGKGKREAGGASTAADAGGGAAVENLTGRVERLSVSVSSGAEVEGKRGGGEEAVGRRRKAGNEGKRNRAGGGGPRGGDENVEKKSEKKGKGNRKNRGGEKEADWEPKKRGGERGRVVGDREVDEQEDERGGERDKERERDTGGFRDRERERDTPKDTQRDRNREGEVDKAKERDGGRGTVREAEAAEQGQEGGGRLQHGSSGKTALASKRYSKSDKRRPRTYSTSSASSGTSMEGPGEAGRNRGPLGLGKARGRGNGGVSRPASAGKDREDWGRGQQLQQKKKSTRDFSSTDSLEESETGREGETRRLRQRERNREDDWSPDRRAGEGQTSRGGAGGRSVGGILRVSFDKPSGAGEDLQRRQEAGPRGRGRGILVLPTHTDITVSPEPGPRLLIGGRGGAGQGRGRGGRGGAIRRLWDPNNPDQKPALTRGQQYQQPLHLQQQGGYGQLHFLDTDDEAAGSPPVRQGEPFQSFPTSQQAAAMNAAAMAYYKFQNSDNPYCYPMPPNAPARYPYPYHIPYQMPGANGVYPTTPSFYAGYGQPPGAQGYSPAGTQLTPEEAELQARG